MNNRRLIPVLLAVFIILAIAAFLQSRDANNVPITPTPDATEDPFTSGTLLRVFPDLTVLDIQAVRIDNPTADVSLMLVRDANGQWTAPEIDGTLDAGSASDIARTIILLPYGRSINIVPATNLNDYGLAPDPQYLISVVLQNGAGHIVAVGKIADAAPVYYAVVDERDEIFEIERGAIDFLTNFLNSPPVNLTN